MLITVATTVTFDPIKEYRKMIEFEQIHPDWKKQEFTTSVSYSKISWQTVTQKEEQEC